MALVTSGVGHKKIGIETNTSSDNRFRLLWFLGTLSNSVPNL